MSFLPPSQRLCYRRIAESDAGFMLELLNSPGWLKYIGDRKVYTLEDSASYLRERIIPTCTIEHFGPYLMLEKESKQPLGNIGIYQRPGLDIPDLGFALLPQYHRKGYTFEAAVHLQNTVVDVGISTLSAISTPDNVASAHLLSKLGFRKNGTKQLPNDSKTLTYWLKELKNLSSL